MRNHKPHLGMTLIELLVVISIMVLLFAVLVPRVRPALDEARIREGARQVNAYLASAQALAVKRNAPVSVVFNRAANNKNACFQLSMAEALPVFAGESESSLCAINASSQVVFNPPLPNDPTLVMPGDLIRFNYRNTLYSVASVSLSAGSGSPQLQLSVSSSLPPLPIGQPVAYQIVRLPIRPINATDRFIQGSSTPPLQLPRGVCVDLGKSGSRHPLMTNDHFHHMDQTDPVVIFAPGGQVGVYFSAGPSGPSGYVPLPGSLYFLVGRIEHVGFYTNNDSPDASSPAPQNDLEFSTRWVSVRARTGQVVTFENSPAGTTLAQHRQLGVAGTSMGSR